MVSLDQLDGQVNLLGDGLTTAEVPIWLPIIEHWESGTLYGWDGQTNRFEIQDDVSLQGDHALHNTNHTHLNAIRSNYGLSRGFKYTAYIRFEGHDTQEQQRVYFGYNVDSSSSIVNSDGYNFRTEKGNERISIGRRDSGNLTELATDTSLSIPTDEWLKLDITMGFEQIEMSLEQLDGTEIASVSANDATHQEMGALELSVSSQESGKSTYVDMITRRPL